MLSVFHIGGHSGIRVAKLAPRYCANSLWLTGVERAWAFQTELQICRVLWLRVLG